MAFAFKELDELLNGINGFNTRVLKVMAEKNDATDIVSIDERRKSQIYFIQRIINNLAEDKSIKAPRKIQILYGAMLTITKTIDNEMGVFQRGSQLRDLLNECMGISSGNAPSHEQAARCFRGLNSFLNFIFTEKDGVKTLVTEYTEPKIDIDKLIAFVKSSYLYEKDEHIAASHLLKIEEGKVAVSAVQFAPNYNLPPRLKEQVKSYSDLRAAVIKMINSEISAHRAGSTKALSEPRGSQLHFLEEIIKSLDVKHTASTPSSNNNNAKSNNATKGKGAAKNSESIPSTPGDSPTYDAQLMNDDHRAMILIGVLLLIRAQINTEYSHSLLSTHKNNSMVHTKISEFLDINHQNLDDIKSVLALTNNYIGFFTVENRTDTEGHNPSIIRKNHIFSDVAKFNVTSYFDQLQKMIYQCRIRIITACEPKKEQKAKASVLGFGIFGGSSSSSKKTGEFDFSDEDEDNNNANTQTANTK